jgi:hypothetical protein
VRTNGKVIRKTRRNNGIIEKCRDNAAPFFCLTLSRLSFLLPHQTKGDGIVANTGNTIISQERKKAMTGQVLIQNIQNVLTLIIMFTHLTIPNYTMGQHHGLILTIFIVSLGIVVYQVQYFGVPRTWGKVPIVSTKAKPNPWSLTTAAAAFRQYEHFANTETTRMRTSYAKLTVDQERVAHSVNYASKLDKLDEATRINGAVTSGIADLAVRELGSDASELEASGGGSLFRMRETLLHFVRDWSDEGAAERNVIFAPILEVLKEVEVGKRGDMKVLVPGSGLARLAWEISQLGKRHSPIIHP